MPPSSHPQPWLQSQGYPTYPFVSPDTSAFVEVTVLIGDFFHSPLLARGIATQSYAQIWDSTPLTVDMMGNHCPEMKGLRRVICQRG